MTFSICWSVASLGRAIATLTAFVLQFSNIGLPRKRSPSSPAEFVKSMPTVVDRSCQRACQRLSRGSRWFTSSYFAENPERLLELGEKLALDEPWAAVVLNETPKDNFERYCTRASSSPSW